MMPDRLKWYYSRLQNMSLAEIINFRIPQFLQTKFVGKNPSKKRIFFTSTKSKFSWSQL